MKGLLPLFLVATITLGSNGQADPAIGTESPFLPPSTAGAVGPQEAAVLEFRGFLKQGGQVLFNIVDVATRKSVWVRKDQAGQAFKVVEYRGNGDEESITVEVQGRRVDLVLAKPKTSKGPPVALRPAIGPTPMPNQGQGPITPVVLNPTSADSNKAIEDTIAEVRRRRLMRQQGAQPGQQGQPGAAAQGNQPSPPPTPLPPPERKAN